jgi:hypothetical protein
VNLKAELEVAHLHEKSDRMHEEMLERFSRLEKALGVRATGKQPSASATDMPKLSASDLPPTTTG